MILWLASPSGAGGCSWDLLEHHTSGHSCFEEAREAPSYLLCDGAGTLDELPLGEAVGGAELQRSGLLHQVDAAVAQLLHPRLDLEADLEWKKTWRRFMSPHGTITITAWMFVWLRVGADLEHYTFNLQTVNHGWVVLHYKHHYRLFRLVEAQRRHGNQLGFQRLAIDKISIRAVCLLVQRFQPLLD